MTNGRPRARRGGPTRNSCLTSSSPKPMSEVLVNFTAPMGLFPSRMDGRGIRSLIASSKRLSRQAIRVTKTSTVRANWGQADFNSRRTVGCAAVRLRASYVLRVGGRTSTSSRGLLSREERSPRRQPRGPRARSVIPNGTKAAVPTDSRQIPRPSPAKPSTGFTELAVSTDIVEPGRKLRGRKVVTDPNPAVDTARDKTVRRRKKKATKAPRRAGSLRRTASERAGAKRRAQKRAASRSFGKKGVAKRAAAKKGAGKVAVAKKTTVRKGGAKGSTGRASLAKKRSAARQTVTTASGQKSASRKIAKRRGLRPVRQRRLRARKPATRRARRSR